jgi:hypothetical protein
VSQAHPTTTRRRVLAGLVPSVLGLGLAAVLTGCGAGQITQTDTEQAAINGANATVGPMAIRNAELAPPSNSQGTYAPGSTARLIVTIVNTGLTGDTLVKVSSPAVVSVSIDGSPTGTKDIPGGFSVTSGQDVDGVSGAAAGSASPTSMSSMSMSPTSVPLPTSGSVSTSGSAANGSIVPTPSGVVPAAPGRITIDLVDIKSLNGLPLRAGLTIPVTFYFAHAGQVTLQQVPIAAPADNPAQLSRANGS